VSGRLEHGHLLVEIRDDGAGGADTAAGTGLAGLADRLAVVGGGLQVSSPPGGPTVLRARIPLGADDGAGPPAATRRPPRTVAADGNA